MKWATLRGTFLFKMMALTAVLAGCSGERDASGDSAAPGDSADAISGQGVTPIATIRGYDHVSMAPLDEGVAYLKSHGNSDGDFELVHRDTDSEISTKMAGSSTATARALAASADGRFIVWKTYTQSEGDRLNDTFLVADRDGLTISGAQANVGQIGDGFRFDHGRLFAVFYEPSAPLLPQKPMQIVEFDPANAAEPRSAVEVSCDPDHGFMDFQVVGEQIYVLCEKLQTGEGSHATLTRYRGRGAGTTPEVSNVADVNGVISQLARTGDGIAYATTVHADLPEGPDGNPEAADAMLWRISEERGEPEAVTALAGVGQPVSMEQINDGGEAFETWGFARMASSSTEVFVARGAEVLAVNLDSKQTRSVTTLQPANSRELWIRALHFGGGRLYAHAYEREPSDHNPLTNEYKGVHLVRIDTSVPGP